MIGYGLSSNLWLPKEKAYLIGHGLSSSCEFVGLFM